jgi:hypothetical protein
MLSLHHGIKELSLVAKKTLKKGIERDISKKSDQEEA